MLWNKLYQLTRKPLTQQTKTSPKFYGNSTNLSEKLTTHRQKKTSLTHSLNY